MDLVIEKDKDDQDDEEKKPNQPLEKWKLEFFEAKKWVPSNATPKKARKTLAKNMEKLCKPKDFKLAAEKSLNEERMLCLGGVSRTGAAKFWGDGQYKQYMMTVDYHLAKVWPCLKNGTGLTKEAAQSLIHARESLEAALKHYSEAKEEKGDTLTDRRDKKIEELKLCLQSLGDLESSFVFEEQALEKHSQKMMEHEVQILTEPGGPCTQVNCIMGGCFDSGKIFAIPFPNGSDKKKQQDILLRKRKETGEELAQDCTLVLDLLATSDPFVKATLVANLLGSPGDEKLPKDQVRDKNLAVLLCHAHPKACQKFFTTTIVPSGELDGILGNVVGAKVPGIGDKGGGAIFTQEEAREKVALDWAEAVNGNKKFRDQVCVDLLQASYQPPNSGTRPLRGTESAAVVLKAVALAGDGESTILAGLQEVLQAAKSDFESNPVKNKGAVETIENLVVTFLKAVASMKLPEGLCASSALIYNTYVNEWGHDEALKLVGGHVCLRVINPMLATGATGGKLGVFVSRLVQVVANDATVKGDLLPYANAVQLLKDKLNAFLERVVKAATDPNLREEI